MIRKLFISAGIFLLATSAYAKAPSLLPVQGHVADGDGTPLDGDVNVQFSLYADHMGGAALYQETQPVTFRGGHFFAYVGDGGTLDLAIFKDNDAMYLGIKVGDDPEMRPRILLATAAYAAYADSAGNAEKLGGKAAADYALKSDTTTLAWTNVTDVPAGIADGIDDDTTYTASTGLALNGTAFSVDQTTIEAWSRNACYDTEAELRAVLDQYYSSTGGGNVSWTNISGLPPTLADGVDDDTLYSAGIALTLNGTTFDVDQTTIESWIRALAYEDVAELRAALDSVYLNQSSTVTWANLTGVPVTLADGVDDDTTYTASTGLDLNGTTFSVNQATIQVWARDAAFDTESELTTLLDDNYVGSGYVPQWAALSGMPSDFADGTDDNTTYAAGSGLALSGTTFNVDQATIEGWAQNAAYNTEAELRAVLDSIYLNQSSTVTWSNLTGIPPTLADGIDADTTYTATGGIDLVGTTFGLSACAEGEVLRWQGGAWTCATESFAAPSCPNGQVLKSNGLGGWDCGDDDNDDTTYTAGTGLALNGTTFSADQTTIEGWARGVAFDTESELTTLLDDNYIGSGYAPEWATLTGVPAGFSDGTDNDTTYSAGDGLSLNGTTFSANQTTIEGWIRNLAYDDVAELRAALDAVYLNQSSTVAWSNITGLPATLADGVDDDTTYTVATPLTMTGTEISLSGCSQGEVLQWDAGNWVCATPSSLPPTRDLIIYTRCAWTGTNARSIGACTPPGCPALWTDLGITGNVKTTLGYNGTGTDIATSYTESGGYQERTCSSSTTYSALLTRCAWTGTNARSIGACAPPACPALWTDLGITGNVKTTLGYNGTGTDIATSYTESGGYQERTCVK